MVTKSFITSNKDRVYSPHFVGVWALYLVAVILYVAVILVLPRGAAYASDLPSEEDLPPDLERAPSVNLVEVVPESDAESEPEPESVQAPPNTQAKPSSPNTSAQAIDNSLVIMGTLVDTGVATRLSWSPDIHITGLASPTPVLVVNGVSKGPSLCLTGGIHGDEVNGVEIIRRVVYELDPKRLAGRVIAVPIVNLHGFRKGSRYLPDRRDLNRFFPGDSSGSLASRIAHSLFKKIIVHCDYLIDIHTGSMLRNNIPQIRADMHHQRIAEFARLIDNIPIIHSEGAQGMLRTAAIDRDIPSITIEAGESLRIQEEPIQEGVKAVQNMIERLGIYQYLFVWGEAKPVFYQSHWIRASKGGILIGEVELGSPVEKNDLLGIIVDPITNEKTQVLSNAEGKVIGMAINQVVMPGFAAFHIGTRQKESEVQEDPELKENIDLPDEATIEIGAN